MIRFVFVLCIGLLLAELGWAFIIMPSNLGQRKNDNVRAQEGLHYLYRPSATTTRLGMAQITEREARVGIDKVVAALRKDKQANEELGRLESVNNVLGFGSPTPGQIAVRFNASFKRKGGGMGPTTTTTTKSSEKGRGVMVGQVKASLDEKTGKVTSCSVFRDLGYGRAFNLKV
jgi:hypothetical protein